MKHAATVLSIAALFSALVIAAEVKLEGVKCVVSGESVSASVSTDYKDGKVYFCCADCIKGFTADTAKYATKANHHLVVTGQAKQAKCPLSGGPIAQDKFVEVSGAKVYFCCDKCKSKVAEATGEEQMNLVFSEAAWKKAEFKIGE